MLRIDHLAYPTFDSGETYRFYTKVMGFRLVSAERGESGWGKGPFLHTAFAMGNGQQITFFEVEGLQHPKDDGLPTDIRHVALSVESREELESWTDRLKAHGVEFWVEDHAHSHSVYFSDPNGLVLEITHRVRGPDENDARQALERVRRWTATRAERPIP